MVRKTLNFGTKTPKTPIAGTRMAKARPCKKCGGRHIPPTGARCYVQASDNSHLSSTLQEPIDTMCNNLQLCSSPVTSPVRVVLPPPATPVTAIEALLTQVDLLVQTLFAVNSRIEGIAEHIRQPASSRSENVQNKVNPVWSDINNIFETSVSEFVVTRHNVINLPPVNSCNFPSRLENVPLVIISYAPSRPQHSTRSTCYRANYCAVTSISGRTP